MVFFGKNGLTDFCLGFIKILLWIYRVLSEPLVSTGGK